MVTGCWGVIDGVKIAVQPVNHPGVTPAKSTWRGSNALPSWSWKGCSGNKAVVEVYTDGASVELFLNEKRIGKRKTKECRAVFRANYEPGALMAIAYDDSGRVVGKETLVSAKDELHLEASVLHEPVFEDNETETVYIEMALCDADGIVEMNSDVQLAVEAEGGEILGFGSANPRTEEDFLSGIYKTYYGRALAVVRKAKGAECTVQIKGESGEGKGFTNRISI